MTTLATLVAGVLTVSPDSLTPETGPATLAAWDSLAHVTIIAAVEQTYGVQFTMPEILSIRTFGDLQQSLTKHGVAAG